MWFLLAMATRLFLLTIYGNRQLDFWIAWPECRRDGRVAAIVLAVGIIHVMRHLTYPIFDPTWLAFLGVSGVALTGGKKFAEAKAVEEKTAEAKPAEAAPA